MNKETVDSHCTSSRAEEIFFESIYVVVSRMSVSTPLLRSLINTVKLSFFSFVLSVAFFLEMSRMRFYVISKLNFFHKLIEISYWAHKW